MNSFLLLTSAALIATCTSQDGFYSPDDSINAAEECVWHTICDLEKPLELKPTIDAILDESVEHFIQELMPVVPERYKGMFTFDNLRSVEIWEEEACPTFCVGKDEEEERTVFVKKFMDIFFNLHSEACSDEERISECNGLNECMGLMQVFNAKMTEEGECYVEGVNFDAVRQMG